MTLVPETRYVKTDDGVDIAYQVVGDGPLDIVLVMGLLWHVEFQWTDPALASCLRRLAGMGRLIMFDKRGSGLSDRVAPDKLPTLEQRMSDLQAVLDEVGASRVAIFAESEGGPTSLMYAATFPERVEALVLFGSFARLAQADDQPWGVALDRVEQTIELFRAGWGRAETSTLFAPSLADQPGAGEWLAALARNAGSPGTIATMLQMVLATDARHLLPTISAPTLVIHRRGDLICPVEGGRYLAERIPGSRYVELEGTDHAFWTDNADAVFDETEEFLTGVKPVHDIDRVLATVLFTDIVGSTDRAAQLGDRRWRELLDAHDRAVRTQLERFRGREIKTIGDAFLATFDGPGRAIQCAAAIRDATRVLGLDVRAGLHTGEIELRGDDIVGMAVHIGARVSSLASAGEILVSSSVPPLVAGSQITFAPRGEHALKGVPGSWQIFAVAS